jgi:hypothetical protein
VVAVDPLASLEITSTYVTLAGRTYEVEGHPASDWVALILTGRTYEILPGWIMDDDVDDLIDQLLDGTVSDEELTEATHDVMTIAAGRPYWYATQLIASVASTHVSWATLHGRMVMRGVRANELSLSAWVDALYASCVEGIHEESDRQKFDQQMDTPPASVPIDEEEEGQAFLALMNSPM